MLIYHITMYHLHFTIKENRENRYELSIKQKMMYDDLEGDNILDDIIIYSDFKFMESDINFMKNDISKELKANHKVFDSKMNYMEIRVNNNGREVFIPSISYTDKIIIETEDMDGLLNQLYGLSDFYQMMYKYKPLPPPEPEIEDEEEENENEEEGGVEEFQYY